MDGSLFFRGLTAFLNFFKQVAMGSFIVGFFTGEDTANGARIGFFPWLADKIFNGLPKPFKPPNDWFSGLSNLVKGSWLLSTVANGLGTPIPLGVHRGKGGIKSALVWAFYALPVWLMAVVILTAPALPTMIVAGLLVPVLIFTILSRKVDINPLVITLLLFIGINFVAGFLSATPSSSIQIAMLVSLFMLTAVILPALISTRETVDFFFLVFLAGAGFAGIVGFYQFVAGYAGQVYVDVQTFGDIRFRIVSTLGNPNVYGMFLVLTTPIAAACVFFLKHPFLKLCSGGLTVLLVANVLLTYSRGSYLALALVIGVFVLMMEKRFVVLFIPALLAVPFLLPPAMLNRLLSIFDMTDTSAAFRVSIWRGSVRIIQDFWMSGIGQGAEAFNRIFPYYAPAATFAEHSHNLILQIMLELGIVGLIVFIGVLACYFKIMVNFMRRQTELRLRMMAAAMISAVIGFLSQGMMDYVFYNFRLLLVFYIFLGLGIAFAKIYDKKGVQENA